MFVWSFIGGRCGSSGDSYGRYPWHTGEGLFDNHEPLEDSNEAKGYGLSAHRVTCTKSCMTDLLMYFWSFWVSFAFIASASFQVGPNELNQ